MGKGVYVGLIPGVCLGVEWDFVNGFAVVDLLILRVIIDYRGVISEE